MSKQPEALRLADSAETAFTSEYSTTDNWIGDAAAELRRLHSVNADLLEALKRVNAWSETLWPGAADEPSSIAAQVRAAIAKAEEA